MVEAVAFLARWCREVTLVLYEGMGSRDAKTRAL